MWFQPLRRRFALLVYPEIQALPEVGDGSKAIGRRTSDNIAASNGIRELDRRYSLYSGVVLTVQNMPAYVGPLYEWPGSIGGETVRNKVARSLISLRRDGHRTLHPSTCFACENYFASIWPADLEWPRHIPRPAKHKREAA